MTPKETRFAKVGTRTIIAPPQMGTTETIAAGTYSLGFDPDMGGFYLDDIKDFTLPSKIYGHNTMYATKILETFLSRPGTITSAALAGQKGSGKTLTAKEICIKALVEEGIPVVEISTAFSGPTFNKWLQRIDQPIVFLVDEFEKVYKDEDERNRLLSLLDGTFKTHKMFIFTMNKQLDSGNFEFFHNRPGRVYFNIAYGAVSPEIIKEYCADHLVETNRTAEVLAFSKRFSFFTLDILTILVNEMNTSPDLTCQEISSIINIKPDVQPSEILFEVAVLDPTGKEVTHVNSEFSWKETPLAALVGFDFPRKILQGEGRNVYFPIYSKEDFDKYREMYRHDATRYIDFDTYFDEDDEWEEVNKEDSQEVADFKKRVAEHRTKPRGRVGFNFRLDSSYTRATQDPETRAVTFTNTISGHSVIISPAGVKEKSLRFTF